MISFNLVFLKSLRDSLRNALIGAKSCAELPTHTTATPSGLLTVEIFSIGQSTEATLSQTDVQSRRRQFHGDSLSCIGDIAGDQEVGVRIKHLEEGCAVVLVPGTR